MLAEMCRHDPNMDEKSGSCLTFVMLALAIPKGLRDRAVEHNVPPHEKDPDGEDLRQSSKREKPLGRIQR